MEDSGLFLLKPDLLEIPSMVAPPVARRAPTLPPPIPRSAMAPRPPVNEPRELGEPDAGFAEGTGAARRPLQFTAVYEEHFAFVLRSMRRLGVPDRHLDDAVQDTFIVVHRKLSDFEGRASVRSWLFAIARRVAHDHRRRVRRKEQTAQLPEGLVANDAGPRAAAERAQARDLVQQLLSELDDDKREVFILSELEGMAVPEIAAAIGVNLNTTYSRLRAARMAFEHALEAMHAKERV